MVLEEKLNHAKQQLQAHARTAFIPNTQASIKLFNTASKFGGFPYLRDAKDWPICPDCKRHMNLMLQLNLEETPIKYADNKGLLQVFYCTQDYVNGKLNCDSSASNYEPFSVGTFLRKINIEGASASIDLGEDATYMFDENVIESWIETEDIPHPAQYDEIGLNNLFDENIEKLLYEEEDGIALAGDKLGGWPHFIQSNEAIIDPEDGKEYVHLMQIDSEDNLNYMFGDSGIAFIGYHPDEPEKLAMFWQCC